MMFGDIDACLLEVVCSSGIRPNGEVAEKAIIIRRQKYHVVLVLKEIFTRTIASLYPRGYLHLEEAQTWGLSANQIVFGISAMLSRLVL